MKIKHQDLEELLEEKIKGSVAEKIDALALEYRDLDQEELEFGLIKIIERILSPDTGKSGKHRSKEWISGWEENLDEIVERPSVSEALIPKYFLRKDEKSYARWNGRLVGAVSEYFEYNLLRALTYWLFDKYLKDAKEIYEFGCGTGQHLLTARQFNKNARIVGLDWAESSQKIINEIKNRTNITNIEGRKFDFFNPDKRLEIGNAAVIYTIAALEQVGKNHEEFINYLLHQKPSLCFHLEPIEELMDRGDLLQYLSVEYIKRRNYLQGFMSRLRELEDRGIVEILEAKRTKVGQLFMEGYSLVVWRPKL